MKWRVNAYEIQIGSVKTNPRHFKLYHYHDPRMAEEAAIIDKAAALGLPQKIRKLAAFALPKKDR